MAGRDKYGVMGIDVGTTGCKAVIYNNEGNAVSSAYKEYSLKKPRAGWRELNPDNIWQSVKEVIAKSIRRYTGDPVKALSISSIGEAVVPIDRKGRTLYNSIIYLDERGQTEVDYLGSKMGSQKIYAVTGVFIHHMYSLGKIMWLKKHMSEVYRDTWKYMPYSGFILYKLGAELHVDYSLAASTMVFDIINKEWSEEIMACAGINRDKFPPVVPPGRIVGEISTPVAREIGLPSGIVLVAGGHDQPCAVLGAGISKFNAAVDGMGTVECITPVLEKPIISPSMEKSNLVCVPHVIKDLYVTYAYNFTAGSILKWFRDNFAAQEQLIARRQGADVYELLISTATDTPTSLFLLPHFAGSGTPYLDGCSRGALIGMDLDTTKADIVKAILEGLTYEMMVNLQCLEEAGIYIDELRAVGGGAKSERWLQLKADMMGKKIVSLNVNEAGTLGAAMLAGLAIGFYRSTDDAINNMVKIKDIYYPDPEIYNIYQEKYEVYKNIYSAIRGISGRSSSLRHIP